MMEGTGRRLRLRFDVPKNLYKTSNSRLNINQLNAMSARLRTEIAPPVWEDAIREQFGVVADEPSEWDHPERKQSKAEISAMREMEDQQKALHEAEDEVELVSAKEEWLRRSIREAKASHEHVEDLKAELESVESELKTVKNRRRSESKLFSRCKNAYKKLSNKAERRISSADRRSYIKAKALLNRDKMIFPGTVRMLIRVNNISKHEFDAPNAWPSIKPLQDGGTDTGVLWRDDNNDIIKETIFYGGTCASRDYYVLEVIVEEISHDPDEHYRGDPFGDKMTMSED